MILNLLDLQKVTVEHAMIPKNDIEGLDINDDEKNINSKLIDAKHTRVPVYSQTLNNLRGFINKKHVPALLKANSTINADKLVSCLS